MTAKQAAVLWLGVFLIIARGITTDQFKSVWSTLDGTGSGSAPQETPINSGAAKQVQNGVQQGTQVPVTGGVAQH